MLVNAKERAKEIRPMLKKLYPEFKFSIRSRDYNVLDMSIMQAPVNMLLDNTKTYEAVNKYWLKDHYENNQEAKVILQNIIDIATKGITYRETSDYGSQPNLYFNLTVGQWDKSFIHTKQNL